MYIVLMDSLWYLCICCINMIDTLEKRVRGRREVWDVGEPHGRRGNQRWGQGPVCHWLPPKNAPLVHNSPSLPGSICVGHLNVTPAESGPDMLSGHLAQEEVKEQDPPMATDQALDPDLFAAPKPMIHSQKFIRLTRPRKERWLVPQYTLEGS